MIFESVGSDDEISMPVGPIEPATKRGRSGVEIASQASRASCAARRLISSVCSPRPYSSSLSREPGERVGLDDVGAGLRDTRS